MKKYFCVEWPDGQGKNWLDENGLTLLLLASANYTDEFKVAEIQLPICYPVTVYGETAQDGIHKICAHIVRDE